MSICKMLILFRKEKCRPGTDKKLLTGTADTILLYIRIDVGPFQFKERSDCVPRYCCGNCCGGTAAVAEFLKFL